MMVPSDSLQNSKKSVLFGEAPVFLRDSKIHRTNDAKIVRMGYFWYWFRKLIVLWGIFSFAIAFLIPYLYLNSTDGYILSGGVLSMLFCILAILSYIHILPWRRHPSSLLIQVCGMSLVLSMVAMIMAYPSGGTASELNDGADINLIGSNDYDNKHDKTPGCLSMSFILQLTLFAREMWILTLCLDLLTNITNPFASYKINLQKYHLCIWTASVLSAIFLIGQLGDCQGEFLSNGTCWIKISGIESICFWGYFMAWVILFYVTAMIVLCYAFSRISKGLESTYATHYAFVVDTFRIVFFFFIYGVMLAGLFLILYYATTLRRRESTLNTLEHVFAFFIAGRGFFDSLIWFCTHGFTDESSPSSLTNASADVTNMQNLMKTISNKRLTMKDVFKPKVWFLECLKVFPICLLLPAALKNVMCCASERNENDGEHEENEEGRENFQAINAHEHGEGDVTTILLSSDIAQNQNNSNPSRSSVKSGSSLLRNEDFGNEFDQEENIGKQRSSQQKTVESSMSRSYQTISTSNIDFSPQLNLALRAEVLYVVTLGIKESVLKLEEREKRLRELAEELVLQHEQDGKDDESGARIRSSFSLRKGGSPGDLENEKDEFVRIRLSSSSGHRYAEVSNILRDIYTNTSTYGGVVGRPSHFLNNSTSLTSSTSAANNPQSTQQAGGTINPKSQQAQRKLNKSFYRNSNSFNPHQSLAFHSVATSSILHSLMSVTGAYLPGEYGVDPMSYNDDVRAAKASTTSTPRKTTKTEEVSPAKTPNVDGKTIYPFDPPSTQSSYQPSFYLDELERISREKDIAVELPPPPAEVVFNVNDQYRFRDFRPATFRKLRLISGMTDEQYLSVISQPTQEKLSEGRSGAFFFVCGEGDVIVKTVESSEAKTLLNILDKYVAHIIKYPESLIVRFFGLHSIRMYGNEFTFVVMKNVFPKGIQLNEKYDIKGSYVQRNAQLKMPGKLSTCRYCHEQFIEGSNDRCSEVIGGHEAIITLKDNDMINKIRLYPGDAYQIIDTLFHDSDALCEMGLMDYSLLVGVKHGYYDIEWFKTSRHFTTSNEAELTNNQNNPSSFSSPLTDAVLSQAGIQRNPSSPLQLKAPTAANHLQAVSNAANTAQLQQAQAAYPARAVIAPKDYYFGVIDILQTWSWSKKLERFIKVYLFGQPGDGVSCVDPVTFKERYQRKIMRVIEHEGFVREVTGSWLGKREIGSPYTLVQAPDL